MDLREMKTKRSLKHAFLKLRGTKSLERITVKELSELAEISKATFYLHYQDIYDLNSALQDALLQEILGEIKHPEAFLNDQKIFTWELCQSFYNHHDMIDILFSGNQAAVLPIRIEREIRAYIHGKIPDMDPKFDMLLTYQIQGGFFVSQEYYKKYGMDEVLRFLSSMSKVTADFFLETLDFSIDR